MENKMYFINRENQLEVIFEGDIDHQTTLLYRERLVKQIDTYKYDEVIFNFENVKFIDSSGIGMVLGRYNQIKQYQGQLYFSQLSDVTYRLFELSGLLKLISIKEVMVHG